MINPGRIDALAARLMAVIDGDLASPIEAAVALLTVISANAQRGPVSDHELLAATDAYEATCGGILQRRNALIRAGTN